MALLPELPLDRLLQRFVAHGLADSPRASALLAELRARRLLIELRGTPWSVLLESSGEALTLAPAATASLAAAPAPDARIIGTPLSLLALGGERAREVIQRGDVQIDGDGAIAERFQELLSHLRPDLETLLSRLLGRSLAHVLMRGARGASLWARASAGSALHTLAEYLAHESRDLVPLAEAEQFLRGVDEAREQLDRADARAHALEQRLRSLAGQPGPA